MVTLPAQLFLTSALGLLSAVILILGLTLLYFATRPRRVVLERTPSGHAAVRTHGGDTRTRRRKAATVIAASLMLLFVFAGKWVVSAFYPRGQDARASETANVSTVAGASGSSLAVARQGSAGTPTLILTHGWGADRGDWQYVVNALPTDSKLVLWDLPGLGESTHTDGDDYSVQTLAADLDRVVDSVNGPVILVGHSVGGILNLEYARRYPEKMGRQVLGVIQVNTTFTNPIETKKNPDLSRALQKPVFEPLLHVVSWTSPVARVFGWLAYQSGMAHVQLAAQSFAGAETWNQLDHMASYAYRSSPRVIALGALGMLRWDGTDVLKTINVPTLVISGNQDVTTLPWASDRMARDIPSASRVSVDRAAHMGPVEQSERYASAISEFSSRISSGQGAQSVVRTEAVAPVR